MSTDGQTVVKQQLIKEKTVLREEIGCPQEDTCRLQEQLANAHKEIDQLKDDVKELREKYEEEQRESIEEMKTAWTFESTELRTEIEHLKGEVERLEEAAALVSKCHEKLFESLLPYLFSEEARARATIESEEKTDSQSVYSSIMREDCLPVPTTSNDATSKCLFKLYRYVKQSGVINAEVVKELLKREHHLYTVGLTIEAGETKKGCFAIPRYDFVPLLRDVIFHLSRLKRLYLTDLLSINECVLPWIDSVPPTLEELSVPFTPFTVANIVKIAERCHDLRMLSIHYGYCIDWGEFAGVWNTDARKRTVNSVCRNIIGWW